MASGFDVNFENYIIFHRGIAEIRVDPTDGHLYVYYQDGTVHDMGNLINAEVEGAKQTFNTYTNTIRTQIEGIQSNVSQMYTDFQTTKDSFSSAVQDAIAEAKDDVSTYVNQATTVAQAAVATAQQAQNIATQAEQTLGEAAISIAQIDALFSEGGS